MASDADRVAAARSYLDALVSHDPSAVPLHARCTRAEMGIRTGFSGAHIARSLARGPQFRVIRAVTDVGSQITDTGVRMTFTVHVRPAALGVAAPVTEDFDIDADGAISRITARFGLPRRVTDAGR